MSAQDDGGAFHPYQPMTDISSGASLRDVIAMHAMQGLLANPDSAAQARLIAGWAYKQADAMLAARKEKAP